MPGLEIQPFADEHLDEAARLLADRHRRHRAAEPLLSEPSDYRAEIEALWSEDGASGAVGIRDGDLVGYLIGIPKPEGLWGPNVWVDSAGHAVHEPEELRDLYALAAAAWVAGGRTRHYAVVPAFDESVLTAWYRLGFGQQQGLGIREVPDVAMPPEVRLAEERDIDAMVVLGGSLPEYQSGSPVFSGGPPETEEELRAEIASDLAGSDLTNLVVELDGRVVGNVVLTPTKNSQAHSGLARVSGACLLGFAATRPEVRGSGAGLLLTAGSFAWAREHGYETMVVDWRITNLFASRFWPRRGFRETFLRLYRSIP
jgi:predicted N-acetyltransferase YhbS